MEVASIPKIGMGVDPEIFIIDKVLQRYTSAHDLAPGTKEEPYPLENGAVQVDGVALEYNTKPAYTSAEFAQYNTDVLRQLRKLLPEDRYAFSFEPAVFFDKVFFENLPETPKELGCNPDFNAYTGKQTPSPKPKGVYETMRTGSGHIHVSWTENADVDDNSHRWDCNYVVKCLEATIGRYLHLWDKDTHRANLYGKPGCLRYRPYGVEWRTPSNAWLRHEALWPWLFEAVTFVVKAALADKIPTSILTSGNGSIYRNSSSRTDLNAELARDIPGFPPMPDIGVDAKVSKKTRLNTVTVAGSMSEVPYDVDLDYTEENFYVEE